VELSDYYSSLFSKTQFDILSAGSAIASKAAILQRILKQMRGTGTTLNGYNVTQSIYYNEPLDYNSNMVNILE
jgi:hypothetical protein